MRSLKNPVKLNVRQQVFVNEYIIDFNATRSAIAAGYSTKTANRIGSQNLTKVDIQDAISIAMEKRNERTQINADYVLNRLVEIDKMDIADIFDKHSNLLSIDKWPKAWRTTISALDVNEIMNDDVATVIKKIKFPDKVKNLELLGKHTDIQAWKDKVEHSGEMTINNLIAEISANNAKNNTSPLPKDNI